MKVRLGGQGQLYEVRGHTNPETGNPEIIDQFGRLYAGAGYRELAGLKTDDGRELLVASEYWKHVLPVGKLFEIRLLEVDELGFTQIVHHELAVELL